MKNYLIAAVATAALYPLFAAVIWGPDNARAAFGWYGGFFVCASLGAVASYARWELQKLSAYVRVRLTPGLMHLISAELVGIFSLILLMVVYWLWHGVYLELFGSLYIFLIFQMPAFLASYLAYYIVDWLHESRPTRGR